jgi:hypothetical protein
MVLLICSISEGVDWEYFMQSNKGDNYYFDLDSIKYTSSDTVRLLRKVELKASSDLSYLIDDIEMDCEGKKIRFLKKTSYNIRGEGRTIQANNEWQDVRAEDMDELLLELVCSLKKNRG